MSPIWRRRDGVKETPVDGDLFLVVPTDGEIYHLNTLGAALWRLLETPMNAEDASATLALAFPEAPTAGITADVERFFAEMRARGLITAV